MNLTRTLIAVILYSTIALLSCKSDNNGVLLSADVVIYGGTSAGISAAIQTARLGKSVILIEPTNRLGGLTTGGLGQTDIGNKQVIGGISREFYQNIRKYYEDSANWIWQIRAEYKDGGQTRSGKSEDAMWTFEPSAALKVFHNMIKDLDIKIIYEQRLNRKTGITKVDNAIHSITTESGDTYFGEVFIDATYEGDLMEASGISYTVGRESNSQYGESLNGIQANKVSETLLGTVSHNSVHHDFIDGVDPYIVKGDSSSGLLPFINAGGPETDGLGDKGIQAYCFRMTLTDHPENRIPFKKPENYDELEYELLFRNYEAADGALEEMYSYGDPLLPWINSAMPNRKTDTNNQKGFSTDFIGQNWDYPEASYEEREEIVERHRRYQQGLMWTLAYHPRIPKEVRTKVSQWGTCKDEYERKDGWQQQLYIREARRMVGAYVMSQKNCEGIEKILDPIGMAAYGMDSHHIKRYVNSKGFVSNEGNVEASVKAPFPISYRSIVPKKEECDNLLVPICLSASHIAFGSIRMEPVFMVLGQSSAVIACLSIDEGKTVQDLEFNKLEKELLKQKQILR
ncbi:FAD-dependent oxidoreductase [Maribacter sp. HTCC2170]|uniref:FAD-dependent oxidoreductase n=1 Tax=Maribacter sp. (strain HTCC2170 / KCCM 42371) TaxID=313603 RepID=UPI00006AFD55|nr:FAD-dependent oxidoreductase [Maribacter sp. HTCC2170]EAR01265.1 probable xanthan lyase [Maribacter sp. HTCC2170]